MNIDRKSLATTMYKKLLCFLSACSLSLILNGAYAQTESLRLLNSSTGFYLNHKVLPKQGLFSIGRQYMVHPHFLAAFNGLDHNKGLQIDQLVRIPLSDTNFDRKEGEGVPIYLTASTDDPLSDLATFAGADVALIQCWNAFTGINVTKGSRWVVGFLKTNEMADRRVKLVCVSTSLQPTEPPIPSQDTRSFFESAYLEQIKRRPVSKNSTIHASFFSSESGWKDAKYFILYDGATPGTIIKLVNPENQNEIFAKVLGAIPRIKQNEGLDLRVSEAALERLSPSQRDRFSVQVIY